MRSELPSYKSTMTQILAFFDLQSPKLGLRIRITEKVVSGSVLTIQIYNPAEIELFFQYKKKALMKYQYSKWILLTFILYMVN